MKKISIVVMIGFLFACQSKPSAEKSFDQVRNSFIQSWWKQFPTSATTAGFHEYDAELNPYDKSNREADKAFVEAWLDSLSKLETEKMNANDLTDLALMKGALHSIIFYADTFKAWQWDPSNYNVAGAFADIINANNIDSLQKRIYVQARIKKVKSYYDAAKLNIENPSPEHTQLAIEQSEGVKEYLNSEVKNWVNHSSDLNEAIAAVNGFSSFLKSILPTAKRDFRIGKELYEPKFSHDIQSQWSATEVYEKAINRKKELHLEMAKLTKDLWSKYMHVEMPKDTLKAISALINKISEKHAHRDSFIQSIEKQIPELQAFVNEKQLLFLDPNKPLKVRRTPGYMDGVAGASISAPGPYDKDAETFYNVSTLEKFSKESAESYLREYNHYILQILNIHEAIPGHYAQLVYSNNSPSIIKSVFGNGAMIEGWAVYTERMMIEAGYGNAEPEMLLMYNKWHLRTVCNTILDYSVHVNGWKKEDAINLLVNEAFQQQAEAEGKWRRVQLSQVQLCSYFTGYSEIFALREEMKKKQDFDLKKFHESFLSFGSAPIKEIRKLMLK
ncbi:MAG: DUF885 domain-containing protein [Bacteroidia bacterium]